MAGDDGASGGGSGEMVDSRAEEPAGCAVEAAGDGVRLDDAEEVAGDARSHPSSVGALSGPPGDASGWTGTVFTAAKAGMETVDMEKVKKVVFELSKGSAFFQNEQRKAATHKERAARMRARVAELSAADIARLERQADRRLAEIEGCRNLQRSYIHIDMDCFYAAVAELKDPSLRGKPVAVGGMMMISTANYEARRYGVRAAMPGHIAVKLCPSLTFVRLDFGAYKEAAGQVRHVLARYDPNMVTMSLDEASLDVTEYCAAHGLAAEQVAARIRQEVLDATRLTCSAGVAPNRMLAKLCTDVNKPNGQFVLANEATAIRRLVSALPIRKVSGIGRVSEALLNELGVTLCEHLLQHRAALMAAFSPISFDFFMRVALGVSSDEVAAAGSGSGSPDRRVRKGISTEQTFPATASPPVLYDILGRIAASLAESMAAEGARGRTLTLKVKQSSFELRTRSVTLPQWVNGADALLEHGRKLLAAEMPVHARLLGLRVTNLRFDDGRHAEALADPRQRRLQFTAAAISEQVDPGAPHQVEQGRGAAPGEDKTCGRGAVDPASDGCVCAGVDDPDNGHDRDNEGAIDHEDDDDRDDDDDDDGGGGDGDGDNLASWEELDEACGAPSGEEPRWPRQSTQGDAAAFGGCAVLEEEPPSGSKRRKGDGADDAGSGAHGLGEDAGGSGSFRCPQCGETVEGGGDARMVHQDWHLALRLAAEEPAAWHAARSDGGGGSSSAAPGASSSSSATAAAAHGRRRAALGDGSRKGGKAQSKGPLDAFLRQPQRRSAPGRSTWCSAAPSHGGAASDC